MPPEAYTAAANAITGTTSHWQLIAGIVLGLCVLLSTWMAKRAENNTKYANKETELRTERRDRQLDDIRNESSKTDAELSKRIDEVMNKVDGVGKSLDRHIDDHKERDEKTQKTIMNIDDRLRKIEANLIERKEFIALCEKVNDINVGVVKMMAIMEERSKYERN
jgi:septal ring factor EnvC (AmiA/AmiB activator)